MALIDALPLIAIIACIIGVRVISKSQGYDDGFDEGVKTGFSILIKELCEGGIEVDGDDVVFGGNFTVYDDGIKSNRISKSMLLEMVKEGL